MPREREDYRPILEDILRFSGQRRILTIQDVATYLGLDYRTVKRRYHIDRCGISAPTLAMKLAKM